MVLVLVLVVVVVVFMIVLVALVMALVGGICGGIGIHGVCLFVGIGVALCSQPPKHSWMRNLIWVIH